MKKLLVLILVLTSVLAVTASCDVLEELLPPSGEEGGGAEKPSEGGEDTDGDCQHVWGQETVNFPGNCTIPSITEKKCTLCGEISKGYGETMPDAHSWGNIIMSSEPNCTTEGWTLRRCIRCQCDNYEILPPAEELHDLFVEIEKATCVSAGYERAECSRCDYELVVPIAIDPDAHSFGSSYYCSDEGHAHVCTACGENGELLPHTAVDWEFGTLTHYKSCTVCGTTFERAEHDLEEIRTEPSYTEVGYSKEVCRVCDYESVSETLDKLEKLYPEFTLPDPIECVYGMTLGDITLPEGFAFISADTSAVGSVGSKVHRAVYTVPGDTEGKYLSVDVEITLKVMPKAVTLAADFSALSNLYYSGKPVAEPEILPELLHICSVRWYKGETLLDGAPTNAGEYSVRLVCTDANYTAVEAVYNFTVRKAPAPSYESLVGDKTYTARPVSFGFESAEGVTVSFFDIDGLSIPCPTKIGKYTVKVTVAESENRLGASFEKAFSILSDITPPVWAENNVYVYLPETEYTLSPIEDGGIDKYVINRAETPYYPTERYVCTDGAITLIPGCFYTVVAYDLSGNISEELYIYSVFERGYEPSNIYPSNGEVINDTAVTLYAPYASAYYIGTENDKSTMRSIGADFFVGLVPGKTYYWYATCAYAYSSSVFSFTVSHSAANTPTLVSPGDGALIYDRIPKLIGRSESGGTVFVAPEGTSAYSEYDGSYQFLFGRRYSWYFLSNNGYESQHRSFTYLYREDECEDFYIAGEDVTYVNTPYISSYVYSLLPLTSINYVKTYADGTQDVGIGSALLRDFCLVDGKQYFYISSEYLKDGDSLYITAYVDNFDACRSKTFVIDTVAPQCGEAVVEESGIRITVGNDNIGANYYYRLNMGEWLEYTEETVLPLEGMAYVELRACDYAGNESYLSKACTKSDIAPAITLASGKLGEPTSQDVVLSVAPVDGECYLYVDGERMPLTEECELTVRDEGTHYVYTSVLLDGKEMFSEPCRIIIDKTAPVLGELIYPKERCSINNTYSFVLISPFDIVEDGAYKIYYQVLGIHKERCDYDKYGSALLANLYLHKSQTLEVEITVVDEAGNEASKVATIRADEEGPVIGEVKLDRFIKDGETKYIVSIKDIVDAEGYYYHMHFQIWDEDGYVNGGESIVNISEYTEGESSFIYDASHLPNGKTYYMYAYVVDDLINSTGSLLYNFYKYDLLTSVEQDGYLFEKDGDKYSLFRYDGDDKELILPESVNGVPYSIGTSFLYGNTTVTSVVIPDSIKEIGISAFEGCTALTSVSIGKGVTSIGALAFSGCTSLTDISLGGKLEHFGNYAFNGVPSSAFKLDGGVYYLGCEENPYQVALRCDKSAESVVIHPDTDYIGAGAFFNSSVTEVALPEGLMGIGNEAFAYSMIKKIKIPDKVERIPTFCFAQCESLTELDLGGVSYIDESAFLRCTALTEIYLGENVTHVGKQAFSFCTSVKEINISSNSLTLGDYAFEYCYGATTLYYNAKNTDYSQNGKFPFGGLGKNADCKITVGKDAKMLPDGIFSAGHFLSDGNVTEIVFEVGATCQSIGSFAFEETRITSLIIPDGVRIIGSGINSGCDLLESIKIPNSVESLGYISATDSLVYNTKNEDGFIGKYLGNDSNAYMVLISVVGTGDEYTTDSGCTLICQGAFDYCMSLRTLILGEEIRFVGPFLAGNITEIVTVDCEGWQIDGVDVSSDIMRDSSLAAEAMHSAVLGSVKK